MMARWLSGRVRRAERLRFMIIPSVSVELCSYQSDITLIRGRQW
jgi:hypothetical protein